jgi:pyruvate/2-oxoglutarate dehydrogenase complex dihydrolipoamide acyltransferase (E2) component
MDHMSNQSFEVKPFHPLRRATIGVLEAASKKHMIHALIEVDVSEPRKLMHHHKAATGQSLSFTSYLIHCLAQAVDRNRHMQAYRDWRNRIIIFDDIDVSTLIERDMGDRKQVVPYIVRSANAKPVTEIHNEIREAQSRKPESVGRFRMMSLYRLIPRFVLTRLLRIMDRFPHARKKNVGTVMLTSVGMFGTGAGWGIPVATHTLNVTVGGIVKRLVAAENGVNEVTEREHLCLTVSFDHDLIDGAPAARFLQRFKDIISESESLKQLATEFQA